MDQTFTCFLLLLSLSATFGKYVVHNELRRTWHQAQDHCRLHHTDLAPISNSHDMERLKQLKVNFRHLFWFGLVRNFTDNKKWMWSGGGGVSTFFWASGQPDNRQEEDYGLIINSMWHDGQNTYALPFFCYRAIVVRQRKTWEEALEYCRKRHNDLASVASETEMLLIKKELGKGDTTDYAWIGLHYFPGHWLWVDGQPLSYEAWGPGGKPACPEVKLACAALQKTEALTQIVDVGSGADLTGGYGVWEARHCEERHYFICY